LLFKGQTLGKYKIIAPLGSGGFGTVYLRTARGSISASCCANRGCSPR